MRWISRGEKTDEEPIARVSLDLYENGYTFSHLDPDTRYLIEMYSIAADEDGMQVETLADAMRATTKVVGCKLSVKRISLTGVIFSLKVDRGLPMEEGTVHLYTSGLDERTEIGEEVEIRISEAERSEVTGILVFDETVTEVELRSYPGFRVAFEDENGEEYGAYLVKNPYYIPPKKVGAAILIQEGPILGAAGGAASGGSADAGVSAGETPSEGNMPEGEVPSEGSMPEEEVPSEGSMPEEKPSEGSRPEEETPSEGSRPEEKPSEGSMPEEEVPSEGGMPEEEVPSEGGMPEEEKPSEGSVPEEETPSEDSAPEGETLSGDVFVAGGMETRDTVPETADSWERPEQESSLTGESASRE